MPDEKRVQISDELLEALEDIAKTRCGTCQPGVDTWGDGLCLGCLVREGLTNHRNNSAPNEAKRVNPETCHRCGSDENPPWFAASPLWNAVMRGGSIDGEPIFEDMVCASCFMALADKKGIAQFFRVTAEQVNVELETVTPSGRVWDSTRFKWVEPDSAPNTISLSLTREEAECMVGGVRAYSRRSAQEVKSIRDATLKRLRSALAAQEGGDGQAT